MDRTQEEWLLARAADVSLNDICPNREMFKRVSIWMARTVGEIEAAFKLINTVPSTSVLFNTSIVPGALVFEDKARFGWELEIEADAALAGLSVAKRCYLIADPLGRTVVDRQEATEISQWKYAS